MAYTLVYAIESIRAKLTLHKSTEIFD